jgi:hypothetical protein
MRPRAMSRTPRFQCSVHCDRAARRERQSVAIAQVVTVRGPAGRATQTGSRRRYGNGYHAVFFWKDRAGVVHLQGVAELTGGAGGGQSAAFVLPDGYRPAAGSRLSARPILRATLTCTPPTVVWNPCSAALAPRRWTGSASGPDQPPSPQTTLDVVRRTHAAQARSAAGRAPLLAHSSALVTDDSRVRSSSEGAVSEVFDERGREVSRFSVRA